MLEIETGGRVINMCHLTKLVILLTIGTAHVGFVVTGNNMVGSILAQKLGWAAEGTASRWNTILSSTSIAGLIAGSFIAGFLVKSDRRKAII